MGPVSRGRGVATADRTPKPIGMCSALPGGAGHSSGESAEYLNLIHFDGTLSLSRGGTRKYRLDMTDMPPTIGDKGATLLVQVKEHQHASRHPGYSSLRPIQTANDRPCFPRQLPDIPLDRPLLSVLAVRMGKTGTNATRHYQTRLPVRYPGRRASGGPPVPVAA